jgi:hypothetical protein
MSAAPNTARDDKTGAAAALRRIAPRATDARRQCQQQARNFPRSLATRALERDEMEAVRALTGSAGKRDGIRQLAEV